MQAGISTGDAADFLGMDERTLRNTYYHHHPDYMQAAATAFGRRSGSVNGRAGR